MNSTCTNRPGCVKPSGPNSCCHAILAKRVPSGHGEMLPASAAWIAMSLPSTNLKVLLSPRSVVLSGFQFSNPGSNGNPLNSGCTDARDTDAEVSPVPEGDTAAAVFELMLSDGPPASLFVGAHGARYAFSVASSSGVTFEFWCRLRNLGNGIAPS